MPTQRTASPRAGKNAKSTKPTKHAKPAMAKRSKASTSAEQEVDRFDLAAQRLAQEEPGETADTAVSDDQEHGASASEAVERADELPADGGEESARPRGRNRAMGASAREGKRGSQPARNRSQTNR